MNPEFSSVRLEVILESRIKVSEIGKGHFLNRENVHTAFGDIRRRAAAIIAVELRNENVEDKMLGKRCLAPCIDASIADFG